jgi:hypothetical protein
MADFLTKEKLSSYLGQLGFHACLFLTQAMSYILERGQANIDIFRVNAVADQSLSRSREGSDGLFGSQTDACLGQTSQVNRRLAPLLLASLLIGGFGRSPFHRSIQGMKKLGPILPHGLLGSIPLRGHGLQLIGYLLGPRKQ